MPDRIGILGSGDVGRTLAAGFAGRDWMVRVGTRNPDALAEWRDGVAGDVELGSFAEAAAFADLTVLAVRGTAVSDVLDLAGRDAFADTVVLDTTNPLAFDGDGPPRLAFGGTDSLGERVQATLPDASVVKCFNTVSHLQMVDPEFERDTPRLLVCGDDPAAKDRVDDVLRGLGWPGSRDAGDIESARYLEALVPLWVILGGAMGTWQHAFDVVQ